MSETIALERELEMVERYLADLRVKKAAFGMYSPAHLDIEIEDYEKKEKELKIRLTTPHQQLVTRPHQSKLRILPMRGYRMTYPLVKVEKRDNNSGTVLLILGILIGNAQLLLGDLSPVLKALIVTVVGVGSVGAYLAMKNPEQINISKLAARLTNIAMAVGLLLSIFAGLILSLTLIALIFMVIWQLLMLLFFNVLHTMPDGNVAARALVLGAVAVNFGAAVSVATPPVAGFTAAALSGQREIMIVNQCENNSIVVPAAGINIAPGQSQILKNIPPAAINLRQEGNLVIARYAGQETSFPLNQYVLVTFDGQYHALQDGVTIKLWELREPNVIVTCG